ncbi:MAG: hypothetical protein Q8S13_05920 [Dehalococcoidia bacterium]|nr:hypothetical protein [Dehalococcoidia bacterium]
MSALAQFLTRCAAVLRQLEPSGPWDDCPGCGGASPSRENFDKPWAWHKPDCEARALVELCESGETPTLALADVPAILKALPSDELRREALHAITGDFCTACGRIDPRCQCENDE